MDLLERKKVKILFEVVDGNEGMDVIQIVAQRNSAFFLFYFSLVINFSTFSLSFISNSENNKQRFMEEKSKKKITLNHIFLITSIYGE